MEGRVCVFEGEGCVLCVYDYCVCVCTFVCARVWMCVCVYVHVCEYCVHVCACAYVCTAPYGIYEQCHFSSFNDHSASMPSVTSLTSAS